MQNRKSSRKIGDRLRHLSKNINDPACKGEALDIIEQHGNNPDVINAIGLHGWSPLFNAVYKRNLPISQALMLTPALDINLRDIYGFSILMLAMHDYNIDHGIIQSLLARNDIDVSFKSYTTRDTLKLFSPRSTLLIRGGNALLLATMKKDLFPYIPVLLDKMNLGMNDYATRLVLRSRNTDLRRTIDEHGSGADHYIYKHISPLTNLVDHLKDCTHRERAFLLPIIERIAKSPHLNANKKIKIQPKDEALFMAARTGDRELTEILLAAGANTTLTDTEHRTAAELAKYCGYQEIAEMIAGASGQALSMK